MSPQELIRISAWIEQLLAFLAVLCVLYAVLRFFYLRRRDAATPEASLLKQFEDSLTPACEVRFLLAILVCALLMRVAWWNSAITAPHWFSQVAPVWIADMFDRGTFWREWSASFFKYQVVQDQHSAVMLPIDALFQWALGPSFHLPVLIGAFWGELTVLLAWLLGRSVESRTVGLFFAAFVAFSPLQLVWSRIGGIPVGGGAHILLTLNAGYLAGKLKSFWLAIGTGLLTWLSLYMYFSARVAIVLGVLAMVAGLLSQRGGRSPTRVLSGNLASPPPSETAGHQPQDAALTNPNSNRRSSWKSIAVLACCLMVPVAIYVASGSPPLKQTIWPDYGGYVGNKDEKSFEEVITRNKESVTYELQRAITKYFVQDRILTFHSEIPFQWGINHGGFCLMPVAILGGIGLAGAFWRFRRRTLWLLLTAAGLALPSLSVVTARRMLILDLAWCALAALGLACLLKTRLFCRITVRSAAIGCAVFLFGLGAWTFGSIVVLNANLRPLAGTPIPFGDGGFGDGITCLRCLQAGKEWQKLVAENDFIILFNNNPPRENRTSPGGLTLYGKTAAIAAGRKGHFLEFYAAASNFDIEPPTVGMLYNAAEKDMVSFIRGRLAEARPDRVVWHFEEPNQWEKKLAGHLTSAGGEFSTFHTPFSPVPGIVVKTPMDRINPALDILARLNFIPPPAKDFCLGMELINRSFHTDSPLNLAGPRMIGSQPFPEWAVGSSYYVRYRNRSLITGGLAGMSIEQHANGALDTVRLLNRHGIAEVFIPESNSPRRYTRTFSGGIGVGCAAYAGSHWWMVDPVSGKVESGDPSSNWLPDGSWMGIAAVGENRLMLASADQRIHVFDLIERKQALSFAAPVWPSVRYERAECTPLVAGDNWYGIYNSTADGLSIYDIQGTHLSTLPLARRLGVLPRDIASIGISGPFLGVGCFPGSQILSYRLHMGTACDGRTIVHLAALGRSKAAGTPWNDPSNVTFGTQGISVDLEQQIHASQLEISLDNNDAYQIDFLLQDAVVASQQANEVIPGWGLAIRTLPVPPKAVESGYNTLRIFPIRGDGSYSLGHIRLN